MWAGHLVSSTKNVYDKSGIHYLIVFEICHRIVICGSKTGNIINFSILNTWNYAKFSGFLGDGKRGMITLIKVCVLVCKVIWVLNNLCIYWMPIQCMDYTATNFTKKHFRFSWNKWESVGSLLGYHINSFLVQNSN